MKQKKLFALVVLIFMLAAFAACARTTPEDDTQAYLDFLTGRGYTITTDASFTHRLEIVSAEEFVAQFGWLYPPDINFHPIPTSFVLPPSVIGMKYADFDGDGTNEMFAILSRWSETGTPWGEPANVFSGLMLQVVDGVVTEIASLDFNVYLNPGNISFEGYVDFFTIPADDGVVIGVQVNIYTGGVWANGMDNRLFAYRLDGGGFRRPLEIDFYDFMPLPEFEDGDFDALFDAFIAEQEKRISDAGFRVVTHPLERAIVMEPQIELITTISHHMTANWLELNWELEALGEGNIELSPIAIEITSQIPQAPDVLPIAGTFELVAIRDINYNAMDLGDINAQLTITDDLTYRLFSWWENDEYRNETSTGTVQSMEEINHSTPGIEESEWQYWLADFWNRLEPSPHFYVAVIDQNTIRVLRGPGGVDSDEWLEDSVFWIMERIY